MKEFTYASAFAGIGGMTMGLKPLGGQGVIAWEYDPSEKRSQPAQEAHKLLHPEIPVDGDICKAQTDEIPDFDVFCFTPPCQSYSVAGKRKGANFTCTSCDTVFVPKVISYEHLMSECPSCGNVAVPEDDRGVLTYQAIRIAKAKRPKLLFMENVKGLVNHDKGNTMKAIIQSMNEIGYAVDFTILNSKYFDVAQNRERVYLIGVRSDLITPEPWTDVRGSLMLPKAKRTYQANGAVTFNFDWPQQIEVNTKLSDVLESSVDEKYYLSEDNVHKLVAPVKMDGIGLPIKEATKKGYVVVQEGDAVNIQFPNSKTRRGRRGEKIANTLEASGCNQGVIERIGPGNQDYTIRKLTPKECLRLQAIPDEYINTLSEVFVDSRLYKFAGNGLTINVIKAIGERLLKYL